MTRDCSPSLVSKCQDCRPNGHHRFGFLSRRHRLDKYGPVSPQVLAPNGRTTQPLYQILFQLVGTFHFPTEQSASIVTNHQRAEISFKIRAESFLIKMATTGTLTRSHDPPPPPTITQVCDIHTSTLCSSPQLRLGSHVALVALSLANSAFLFLFALAVSTHFLVHTKHRPTCIIAVFPQELLPWFPGRCNFPNIVEPRNSQSLDHVQRFFEGSFVRLSIWHITRRCVSGSRSCHDESA